MGFSAKVLLCALFILQVYSYQYNTGPYHKNSHIKMLLARNYSPGWPLAFFTIYLFFFLLLPPDLIWQLKYINFYGNALYCTESGFGKTFVAPRSFAHFANLNWNESYEIQFKVPWLCWRRSLEWYVEVSSTHIAY